MKKINPRLKNTKRPPIYDPYNDHIHIWKYGTISSIEDPCKKFISFKRETFTGNYCSLCHTIKNSKAIPIEEKEDVNILRNREDVLKKTFNLIFKEEMKFDLPQLILPRNRKRKLTQIYKMGIEDELFIYGCECEYITYNKTKSIVQKGIMIGDDMDIKNKKRYIYILNKTKNVKVNSNYVFPQYNKLGDGLKFTPVGEIPKFLKKNCHDFYIDKVRAFKRWKETIKMLKKYLIILSENVESKFFKHFQKIKIYNGIGKYKPFERNYDIVIKAVRKEGNFSRFKIFKTEEDSEREEKRIRLENLNSNLNLKRSGIIVLE